MNTIHTASDLAHAQSELEATQVAAEKAGSAVAALETRVSEKETALAIVRNRRIEGNEIDSDAPTIHLLQLDISGLRPLVESARVQYQTAAQAHQQAQILVQQCEKAHDRATAESAAQALEAQLHNLENLLLSGIADLDILKKKASGSIHIHGATLYRFSDRLKRFLQQGVLQRQ